MNEIIFHVQQADEGGYVARALGESIFTGADSLAELRIAVQDAVRCHFDDGKAPGSSGCTSSARKSSQHEAATRSVWKGTAPTSARHRVCRYPTNGR